jgi:two-component system response regulator FixJ
MHVALIDDDAAVLDSLRLYLERQGVQVTCFSGAADFLAGKSPAAYNCIVADVRMPGMSGIELINRLKERGDMPPVVLITGHGDVEMAVTAIKLGAFDFIEKPFDEGRLLESIRNSAASAGRVPAEDGKIAELRQRVDSLSERQRQVLELAAAGLSNKGIANRLGISVRTVENHRAWMMERMGARNLAELVRIFVQIEKA